MPTRRNPSGLGFQAAERNQEAETLLEKYKENLADARRQANELLAEGKDSR